MPPGKQPNGEIAAWAAWPPNNSGGEFDDVAATVVNSSPPVDPEVPRVATGDEFDPRSLLTVSIREEIATRIARQLAENEPANLVPDADSPSTFPPPQVETSTAPEPRASLGEKRSMGSRLLATRGAFLTPVQGTAGDRFSIDYEPPPPRRSVAMRLALVATIVVLVGAGFFLRTRVIRHQTPPAGIATETIVTPPVAVPTAPDPVPAVVPAAEPVPAPRANLPALLKPAPAVARVRLSAPPARPRSPPSATEPALPANKPKRPRQASVPAAPAPAPAPEVWTVERI